jgi:hypothetical protein
MDRLTSLVSYEPANSALAFRERVWTDRAELLRDVLALANAEVTGPRFLFIGVRDGVGAKRALVGLGPDAIADLKKTLAPLIANAIEPPLTIGVRALTVAGAALAFVCLTECDDPPYLLRKSVAGLAAGSGWQRRGTQQARLLRSDLRRLFERRAAGTIRTIDARVGFAGVSLLDDLELPVLELDALPSALAAQRLRRLLEAKSDARETLGRTVTHLERLVHARLFGAERTYESHSDESLKLLIDNAELEYRAADEHYSFEIRAHKLDLAVRNSSNVALANAMLRLELPRIAGIGVAAKLYSPTGTQPPAAAAYPLVSAGARTIEIEGELGTIPAVTTLRAFREPPRLWVRAAALGKTIPLDYTLHARELREPLRDTLVIRVVGAAGGARSAALG